MKFQAIIFQLFHLVLNGKDFIRHAADIFSRIFCLRYASAKLPFFILNFAICTLHSLPAFPGAQGWGSETAGGRNGQDTRGEGVVGILQMSQFRVVHLY